MSKQLTNNFHLNEFKCRDGSHVPDEYHTNVETLADNLQVLRTEIGIPIKITSGYRSPNYNKRVGGAKKSQHLEAKAADLVVVGLTTTELREIILRLIKEGSMTEGGVGLYNSFVHYDIRGQKRRWYGKGMKP
jgi:uncharacterized protein YcbK (DUF882 family)